MTTTTTVVDAIRDAGYLQRPCGCCWEKPGTDYTVSVIGDRVFLFKGPSCHQAADVADLAAVVSMLEAP